MHPNLNFRKASDKLNIDFARDRSFGTLAMNAENGPLLAHIPFLLSEDGAYLEAHLVRSNPILKLLENPQKAVISIIGTDSYISPDWYEVDDQVPTWNYVAVHLRGEMQRLAQDKLPGILEHISNNFETRLAPKQPWKMDKVSPPVLAKMQRMIVPISMQVATIDGTWKLAQNKPDEVRMAAANQVEAHGIGQEVKTLAGLMRTPPC